jgi:hypothetical protein
MANLIVSKDGCTGVSSFLRDSVKMQMDNNMDLLNGRRGWANINNLLHFNELRSRLDEQGEASMVAARLPKEMVGMIKPAGSTVSVMPLEICYCPANGLKWKPMYALQSYNTYTAALDLRDSLNYAGQDAADFLIIETGYLDNRNIMLDMPASWRNILSNYELVYRDGTGRLLLKKKQGVAEDTLFSGESTVQHTLDWIDIPQSGNLLFARIDMQLNLAGRLAKMFFRVPPVYLEMIYESGTQV